jgi:hypothetical protein
MNMRLAEGALIGWTVMNLLEIDTIAELIRDGGKKQKAVSSFSHSTHSSLISTP